MASANIPFTSLYTYIHAYIHAQLSTLHSIDVKDVYTQLVVYFWGLLQKDNKMKQWIRATYKQVYIQVQMILLYIEFYNGNGINVLGFGLGVQSMALSYKVRPKLFLQFHKYIMHFVYCFQWRGCSAGILTFLTITPLRCTIHALLQTAKVHLVSFSLNRIFFAIQNKLYIGRYFILFFVFIYSKMLGCTVGIYTNISTFFFLLPYLEITLI